MRLRLLACLLVLVTGRTNAEGPVPLAAQDLVAGQRVDAYPALWWQWVNRKRWGAQAFQDPTGAQCGLSQSGEVWFLAGTDGTDRVSRRCRIPEDKYVFLPLITMLVNSAPGKPNTCAAVKATAAENNEHVVPVSIRLDGREVDIRSLRMKSECFNAYAKADYLRRTDAYYPSATDGYWLMLAPLKPGKHRLQVNIHYDHPGHTLGDLEQDFVYELQIGGPPLDAPAPDGEEQWEGLET